MKPLRKKISVVLAGLVFMLTGMLLAGNAGAQSLLDWASVFNSDGTAKTFSGWFDAVYLQDNISAGVATDMTALGSDGQVYNDALPSAHDLGNGYVFATSDSANNLIIYAGVERLNSLESTHVTFEFNQDVVVLRTGNPWPVYGARTPNDLLIRMNFISGFLNSVEYKKWDGSAFQSIGALPVSPQDGCYGNGTPGLYAYCIGTPVLGLPPTNKDVWDINFVPVSIPNPDSFVEVKVNAGMLVGNGIEFTSIAISTPEDISLGSFKAMGLWAR